MQNNDLLSLDVGTVRVGVARAHPIARIAEPVTTLMHDGDIYKKIVSLCREYKVKQLIIGLPQNMQQDDTDQTKFTRQFARALQSQLPDSTTILFHDEAQSSQNAEALLKKSKKTFSKSDIDAMAASLILQDYLNTSYVT